MPLYHPSDLGSVSIKRYNAVGDGVTDDTAAFTAAFADAPAQIVLPPGTYKISSGLTPPLGSQLIGNKYSSIIRPTAAVDVAVTLDSDSIWQGFTIDGQDTTGKKGLVLGTSTDDNIVVRDFMVKTFAGSGAEGVEVASAVHAILDNGYIHGCQRGCVMTGTGVPTATMFRNVVFHSSVEEGLYAVTALVARFSGCVFESNGKEGVNLTNSGNVWGLTFQDCWWENNCTSSGTYQFIADDAAADIYGGYFNSDTIKAVQFSGVSRFYIKNIQCKNDTGWIQTADTAWGFIEEFPLNLNLPNVLDAGANTYPVTGPERVWVSWTPSYTPGGSMTFVLGTLHVAVSQKCGKSVNVSLNFTGTLGGTASNVLAASLPSGVVSPDNNRYYPCHIADGDGTVDVGWARPDTGGNVGFYKKDFSNYTLGASFQAIWSGTMESD